MKRNDLLKFTRLLSLLLNAGLGIKESILIIEESISEISCKTLAVNLKVSLDKGLSFYTSMKTAEPDLPHFYLQLLAAGEKSGDLRRTVYKLNTFLARRLILRDKFLNAALYPLIVLVTSITSLLFISIFVIPKITGIYANLGIPLSNSFSLSIAALKMLMAVVPSAALSCLLLFLVLRFEGNKNDRIRIIKQWFTYSLPLKLPFISTIVRTVHVLYILLSLETLTSCGASVINAIGLVAESYQNPGFQSALKNVESNLRRGMNLSRAFSKEIIFPREITTWISLGERTGKTTDIFEQLSMFYEKRLERLSVRFMKLIEPVLILFTGLLLLGMVYLIIIPLFRSFGLVLQ